MSSLSRPATKFLCLVLVTLLLSALPAVAAPASAPEERADLIETARSWMGGLLDSVLAALGLTSDTEDPAPTDDTTTPSDPLDPTSTTTTDPTPDGEGGNWDPNG